MVAAIVKAILAALTGLANALFFIQITISLFLEKTTLLAVVFFFCLKIEINL